jgi:hypothetical protein
MTLGTRFTETVYTGNGERVEAEIGVNDVFRNSTARSFALAFQIDARSANYHGF